MHAQPKPNHTSGKYLFLQRSLLLPSLLLLKLGLLSRQVRKFFQFRFIESIDEFVDSFLDKDFFDLFLAVETDLAGRHGGLFVEVAPGSIDYCNVVFFVACASKLERWERRGPSMELALVSWAQSVRISGGMESHVMPSGRRR